MGRSSPWRALAQLAVQRAKRLPREPCPFCGGPADAAVLSWGVLATSTERNELRVSVGCSNKRCRVKPLVELTDPRARKPGPLLRKAVGYWNRRAP